MIPKNRHSDLRFQHVDYSSTVTLSQTCKHLHNVNRPIERIDDSTKQLTLLRLEWAEQHAGDRRVACFQCWKILPVACFAEKQVTKRHGKLSRSALSKSACQFSSIAA